MDRFVELFGKGLTIIIAAFFGAVFGLIIRFFSFSTKLDSIQSIVYQYLPWALGGAFLFAILAYIFPKTFGNIFCFFSS